MSISNLVSYWIRCNVMLCIITNSIIFSSCGDRSTERGNDKKVGLILDSVNVVDVETGILLYNAKIIICDTIIEMVVKSDERIIDEDKYEKLNCHGMYATPGLIDMHIHLSATSRSALPLLLAYGITTVRDMGGIPEELNKYKVDIKEGRCDGPRIIHPGPILNGKAFNPLQLEINNEDSSERIINGLKLTGASFVKIHRRISREVYTRIIETAKKNNLKVCGHVPLGMTVKEASEYGQHSIEHIETLFEYATENRYKNSEQISYILKYVSEIEKNEDCKSLRSKNVYFVPTMVASKSIMNILDSVAFYNDTLNRKYISRTARNHSYKFIPFNTITKNEIDKATMKFELYKKVISKLSRNGVKMLIGTDCSLIQIPGISLHEEMEIWQEANIEPAYILQAGTVKAAQALGYHKKLGEIKRGYLAELIITEKNPLVDVRNLREIEYIYSMGKLADKKKINLLKLEAESLAKE